MKNQWPPEEVMSKCTLVQNESEDGKHVSADLTSNHQKSDDPDCLLFLRLLFTFPSYIMDFHDVVKNLVNFPKYSAPTNQ